MRYFALDANDNIMSYTNAPNDYHYDYSTIGVTRRLYDNIYNYNAMSNALDQGPTKQKTRISVSPSGMAWLASDERGLTYQSVVNTNLDPLNLATCALHP